MISSNIRTKLYFNNGIIFFVLLLICSACIKDFNHKIPSLPQKVVVNSLFCPYSAMKIHVSLSSSSLNGQPEVVHNAEIWLYENDSLIKYTNYQLGDYYPMFYFPKQGKTYKIKVKVPGFEEVHAESSVPIMANIQGLTCKILPGFSPDEVEYPGTQNSVVHFIFDDDGNSTNYYELYFIFGDNPYGHIWGDISNYPHVKYLKDPSILSDCDLDFNPSQFYFTDKLFNGETKDITLNYLGHR